MLCGFFQELQGAVTSALGALRRTGPTLVKNQLILAAIKTLTTTTTLDNQEPELTTLTNKLSPAGSDFAEQEEPIQEFVSLPVPMENTTDTPAAN